MNTSLLKSLIVRHDGKQENLAEAMCISLSRLNAKINGKNAEFDQSEIQFIKDRYGLTIAEVGQIFFDDNVSKKDTEEGMEM